MHVMINCWFLLQVNEITWNKQNDQFFLTNGNGCVVILRYAYDIVCVILYACRNYIYNCSNLPLYLKLSFSLSLSLTHSLSLCFPHVLSSPPPHPSLPTYLYMYMYLPLSLSLPTLTLPPTSFLPLLSYSLIVIHP